MLKKFFVKNVLNNKTMLLLVLIAWPTYVVWAADTKGSALGAPAGGVDAANDKIVIVDATGPTTVADTVQNTVDAALASPVGTIDLSGATVTFGLTSGDIPDISATYEPQMNNSAGLAGAVSDETGTGVVVFGTEPTISLPTITNGLKWTALAAAPGSPASGVWYYADNDNWDPASVDGTVDYWVLYDGASYKALVDEDGDLKISSLNLSGGTFTMPTSTSGSVTAATGQLYIKTDQDSIVSNGGDNGEIPDEFMISGLTHEFWSFDPVAVCAGTTDRILMMTVGKDFPNGFIFTEIQVSFDVDPTQEASFNLYYANDFIGVASATLIDVLDTATGIFSETTAANINSGNAVPYGKKIYGEFTSAYTEASRQMIVEFWGYSPED